MRIEALLSEADQWQLHLSALPGWFRYSEDRHVKGERVSVEAEDDLGGTYLNTFGGSTKQTTSLVADVSLRFLPRLDPQARALTLTVVSSNEEVAVQVTHASSV